MQFSSLAQAYLEQAKADFRSYMTLKFNNQPTSQWLHCLQMSMEKTGKAYLAAHGSDFEQLRKSHLAFGRFVRILERNRNIQKSWKISKSQLHQHLKQLLPLIDSIERLAPALSTGPNATDPVIYGSNTNQCILKENEVVEIILNNNDPGK